ncbi:NAD-dependent epimerase/dehydratase family protein [Legionella brunensis]|uniref:3-beta-hydroxysteroid dehydrogenase/isomerase n=1 Tax=Legionella brunensis TaxID=29422 RepID=A0A0W0SLA0_9GAMM|nr:NAD-dependent epimerase/dehydratase family protein [Legionella brunensis]KTC84036.1 3-beta-hydroxysteroid dehydrogenase/isomerase [Legionella brunensis]
MKVLVTGGTGFLGKVIVQQLLDRGDKVRVYCRGNYPDLMTEGVEMVYGDMKDSQRLFKATQGIDAVIHTASKVGVWGAYEDYYQCNVIGTESLISACKKQRVSFLVYTSSPSTVFDGHEVRGADEGLPYPTKFLNAYGATKAKAEQLVMNANSDALKTVALRPHLIWGPHDNQLIPRLIERARRGVLKLINNHNALVDTVYVDNAAQAHLLALEHLKETSTCAGKVYFISQDEPVEINAFINRILMAADLPAVQKTISPKLAYGAGAILEFFYKLLGIRAEPMLTRFVAKQLTVTCWYDISAAKRDIGYRPEISIEEGLRRVSSWLRQNERNK